MKDKTTKRRGVAAKLIPATCMLLVSATALVSSTYAWFTMSREVEVTGIKMTATVPEDLQISLGNLAKNDHSAIAVESDGLSLANSTGVLLGSADNGGATDPVNSWDWASTADISAYYKFGKLMPASSRDGAVIYYTADATGTGRTVNNVAKYFAANDASGAFKTGGTSAPTGSEDSAKATLHAYTARSAAGATGVTDTWSTYQKATGWDTTNDDGYYVDIPVWLRSSATEDINIKVAGYVLPGSTDETNGKKQTDLELYRAVRVAILNGDTQGIKVTKTGTASAVTTNSVCVTDNVLPLADAWNLALDNTTTVDTAEQATHLYKKINGISNPFSGPSIVDSGIYLERTTETTGLFAVNSLTDYTTEEITADLTGHITSGDKKANYTSYTTYNGNNAIATIKANTTTDSYGDAKKLIIRVWLDGEDTECWNDNAGQDWAISLRFTKVDIPTS